MLCRRATFTGLRQLTSAGGARAFRWAPMWKTPDHWKEDEKKMKHPVPCDPAHIFAGTQLGKDLDRLWIQKTGRVFSSGSRKGDSCRCKGDSDWWTKQMGPGLETYEELHGHYLVPQGFVIPSEEPWHEACWGFELGDELQKNMSVAAKAALFEGAIARAATASGHNNIHVLTAAEMRAIIAGQAKDIARLVNKNTNAEGAIDRTELAKDYAAALKRLDDASKHESRTSGPTLSDHLDTQQGAEDHQLVHDVEMDLAARLTDIREHIEQELIDLRAAKGLCASAVFQSIHEYVARHEQLAHVSSLVSKDAPDCV